MFRSPLSDTILRNSAGADNYRVAVTGEVRDDYERGGHRLIEDLARGCRHHAAFHLAPHADGRDAALLSRLSSDHGHVTIDGWLGAADGRNEVEIISITPDHKGPVR